jgi:hypothetical protein
MHLVRVLSTILNMRDWTHLVTVMTSPTLKRLCNDCAPKVWLASFQGNFFAKGVPDHLLCDLETTGTVKALCWGKSYNSNRFTRVNRLAVAPCRVSY